MLLCQNAEIKIQENIDPEKVVVNGHVVLHQSGLMKFVSARSFSTSAKEVNEPTAVVRQVINCTNDCLLFAFTDKGNFGRMIVRDLKERKLREKGFALSTFFSKAAADERIVSLIAVKEDAVPTTQIVAYTTDGMVRVTALSEYMMRDDWGAAIKLKSDQERVVGTEIYREELDVVLATAKGYVLRTPASGFMLKGRLTLGAGAIRLDEDDRVVGAFLATEMDTAVCVNARGYAKVMFLTEIPRTDKMRKGTAAMADLQLFAPITSHDSVVAYMPDENVLLVPMKRIMLRDVYDRGDPLVNRLGAVVNSVAMHRIDVGE